MEPSLPGDVPQPCTLDDVRAQVLAAVDYLRIAADAPAADGWMCCADLISAPERLVGVMHATAPGRGTQDDTVAASLFIQGYAFRLASLVLAPYALGLPSPSCDPRSVHIRIARNRPAGIAVTDHAVSVRPVASLARELFVEHLTPLIAATTGAIKVGSRLLWGNVAASTATLFRAIDGAAGADRDAVQRRASDLFDAAAPWLAGLGRYETQAEGDVSGWYWTRSNCCLWYQCSGGSKCDDCSLHSAAELTSIRRAQLVGVAS
ncbi:MAG TPA: IucA/IucC family C-terminal-domain containing protein [Pseudonocardia sp.]